MAETSFLDLAKLSRPWCKSQKVDALLSIVALSQIVLSAIQGVLVAIRVPEEIASVYRVYLSAITIIIAIPFLLKRKPVLVIVTYLVALAIYFFHTVFFPGTVQFWKDEAFRFTLPICIPTVLCVVSIKDKSIFFYYLELIAYITGFFCLIYGATAFLGSYTLGANYDYNQGYGYMLLFPIIVLFYQKKWYSLLFSVILFVLLLLYGGRGPLLAILLFFAFVLVKQKRFVLIGILVALYFVGIPILASTAKSLGISSRMLELMVTGEMGQDNGRDAISEEIERGIQQNPYGWGLFGDRVITDGTNYAHNFILEVQAEFGLYIGILVLIIFGFEIIRRFFKLKGGDQDMFTLFLCACFVPMLFSGSYLTSTNFALFIGVMLLLPKYYKKRGIQKLKRI